MRTPETLQSGWEKSRAVTAAATLAASMLLAACSASSQPNQEATASKNATPTTTSPDCRQQTSTAPDVMWCKALYDMRDKVDKGQELDLKVAKNKCIYWPISIKGAYTVQRSPVLYEYKEGNMAVNFYPFVGNVKDKEPFLMNGPYLAFQPDEEGRMKQGTGRGNMESVLPAGNVTFYAALKTTIKLEKELPATPFTATWALDQNGERIMETKVVLAEDFPKTFADTCQLVPPAAGGVTPSTATA